MMSPIDVTQLAPTLKSKPKPRRYDWDRGAYESTNEGGANSVINVRSRTTATNIKVEIASTSEDGDSESGHDDHTIPTQAQVGQCHAEDDDDDEFINAVTGLEFADNRGKDGSLELGEQHNTLDNSRYHSDSTTSREDHDSDILEYEDDEEGEENGPLIIDPNGDLIVIAGKPDTGATHFLVNSEWLQRIPKWKEFLERHPPEVPAVQREDVPDHHSPDGAPERHHQNYKVHPSPVKNTDAQSTSATPESEGTTEVSENHHEDTGLLRKAIDDLISQKNVQSSNEAMASDRPHCANIEAHNSGAERNSGRQSLSGWDTELLRLVGDGPNIQLNTLTSFPTSAENSKKYKDVTLYFPQKSTVRESETLVGLLSLPTFTDNDHDRREVVESREENDIDEARANQPLDTYGPTKQNKPNRQVLKTNIPQYPVVYLPEDHHEAVGIVLLIIHLRMDLLPSVVDMDTIYELALHCERFQTEHLVKDRVGPWINRLLPRAFRIGSMRWLYIAWVFQFPGLFEAHMQHLVCTTAKSDSQLIMEDAPSHGSGPRLLEILEDSRHKLIENILEIVSRFLNEDFWHPNFKCQVDQLTGKSDCSEHGYISFVIGMRRLGFWEAPFLASSIEESPSTLREKLYNVRIGAYTRDHERCLSRLDELKETTLANHLEDPKYYGKSDRLLKYLEEPSPIDKFREEILLVSFDLQELKTNDHFKQRDSLGESSLFSQMGTYRHQYGFEAQDFGHTSYVKSAKRRRAVGTASAGPAFHTMHGRLPVGEGLKDKSEGRPTKRRCGPCWTPSDYFMYAMRDHLSDDDESDFEVSSSFDQSEIDDISVFGHSEPEEDDFEEETKVVLVEKTSNPITVRKKARFLPPTKDNEPYEEENWEYDSNGTYLARY